MWGRMASCAAIGNRRACRAQRAPPLGTQVTNLPHNYLLCPAPAFATSTANTYVSPNMFERNTTHF